MGPGPQRLCSACVAWAERLVRGSATFSLATVSTLEAKHGGGCRRTGTVTAAPSFRWVLR